MSNKKRGRKPKKKFTTSKKIYSSDIIIDNNYTSFVLHLPIDINELNNEDISIIKPLTQKNKFKKIETIKKNNELKTDINNMRDRIINIMCDFSSSVNKNWPTKTDLVCDWDFCLFENTPIGIPKKLHNEKYYCYGNFCSFECAAAYLNHNKLKNYNYYEEYSLLNGLYQNIYKKITKISAALSRKSLKKCGGPYDIQTFRKLSKKTDLFHNIIYPPLIPIIPFIEERIINDNKQTIDTSFIPISKRIYDNTANKNNFNNSSLKKYFVN